MMVILGTSGCCILNYTDGRSIEGTAGYVNGAVIDGVCTYEAGQSSLGDNYDWFVRNCVPEDYRAEARARDISIHKLLREKAQGLRVGESGLLCIDWFNGNRSILANFDLSGAIIGLTLTTKPEEIYRAIIEGTAFGAKMIIDHYEKNGIEIKRICAAGGIAQKDEMLMQIFADVLGKKISVASRAQASAFGSTIYASVAAGIYPTVEEASQKFAKPDVRVYVPDENNHRLYSRLYTEYKTLHDYFGKANGVMKALKEMKE
jgi:L-ribulokinase